MPDMLQISFMFKMQKYFIDPRGKLVSDYQILDR